MLTAPSRWPIDANLQAAFEVLAAESFADALRNHEPQRAASRPWKVCRVIEALYDPGVQLRIAYVLGPEPTTAWPQADLFYARYPVRAPMSRRGSVLNINGVDVEAYRFPNDRRLRGMRHFSRRNRAAQAWQRWLADKDPDLILAPSTLRRTLLRYVPEQKWIIRLHGCCRDTSGSTKVKRALAVQAAGVADCRRILHCSRSLRRQGRNLDAAFHIPGFVAFEPALGLFAVRWAWGEPLLSLLSNADAARVLERVAAGLYAFHGSAVDDLPVLTTGNSLAQAEACAADLSAVLPALRARLDSILASLRRNAPSTPSGDLATVHNDFHWGQLRGDDQRLTILDFDRCSKGSALIDVAAFAAQLAILPFRAGSAVQPAQAACWRESFLSAWERISGQPINEMHLGWHASITWLNLARGVLRHLRQDWLEVVTRCTETAALAQNSRNPEGVW